MLSWISWLWGGEKRRAPGRRRAVRASYDAAQTTPENQRHWANADALSATAAHSPAVRKRLRERARYEIANNSYAKGIVLTLANSLIGPGPRLQVQTPDQALNRAVEGAFSAWARAIRLPDQLRIMKQAKTVDGEAFAVKTTNPALPTAVKLDMALIEADQVMSPDLAILDSRAIDGVRLDEWGNPSGYDVLRYHPGDVYRGSALEYDTLPAGRVLHWYRCDRPGQLRGVPELTPALPLFAQLRRFTLATLTAAETAAMFAAMLETTASPDEEDSQGEPFESLEIERGMMTTLPAGYRASQLRAEHPTTTYEMFTRLILREIARCLNVPWNVAAGDSSSYNYSSARLDHLNYWAAVDVERQDCEREALDPLLADWLGEAALLPGLLPMSVKAYLPWLPHTWHWPARQFIDPQVEAAADTERLNNGTTTLATVCASRGEDWQEVIRQRAREQAFTARVAAEAGVPSPSSVSATVVPLAIAAAATPTSLRIAGTASVEIQAADGAALRRFEMTAYTGGPMRLDGFDLPVIVDLAGLTVPSQRRPILRDHLAWKIIGHTEEVRVGAGDLRVSGVISGSGPHVAEVMALADNGFPWQASIGTSADVVEAIGEGQAVEVNGQSWLGPLYVVRRATLREVSFVANGADGNTAASVAASGGSAMTFEEFLAMLGLSVDQLDEQQMATYKMVWAKAYPESVPPAAPDQSAASQDAAPPAVPAAAPAAPVAAAAPTPIQATANPVQQMRNDAAAEVARQAAIRRVCASHPDTEVEVSEGGQRRRVNLLAHAIQAGWTAEQAELHILRTDRATGTPFGFVRSGTPAVTPATVEAALCRTLRLPNLDRHFQPQVLEAADRQFRAIGLQQVLIMAAAQHGYQAGPGMRITSGNVRQVLAHAFPQRVEAGWTSLSLPGIFSNVANKEILQGYMEEDQTWREIAGIRSVSDFKQVTSYRLLDSMEYEKVGPGGEIKNGKLEEESYTRQVDTYAKMLAITRQDIINDDLGAFDDLRARLGRGAAQKFNNVFWTAFMANASTFWTTARTNYIEGATTNLGTDGVGLGLGVKAFRLMRSPSADGSKRIGGRPEILLVPPELEAIADQLYEARNVASVKVSDANIHAGKYRPVVSPWLSDSAFTGYSATAWYLLRSPAIAPAVVASFLNGQETPTIEDAEADFSVLGVQFRGYHDFGVDQAEYLCGVKSKGAT